jgi:asparagine synthase (glutamine-hydrolysing)
MMNFPWRARAISSSLIRRFPAQQYDKFLRGPLQLLPAGMRPNLIGDKIHKAAGIAHLNGADEVYRALISAWQQPGDVVVGGSEPWLRVADDGISDPVRRMMFGDLVGYLPDDILVKVDRASMAVGLEARVPLLDHRIVEFTWGLPLALLRRDGQSKWPLRQVLSRYVPPQLTTRTKMGFGVPIDSWLRGPLKSWAQDLLDEKRLKREGFFHADKIGAAWRGHQSGHQNLQGQLWSVLMFQAWYEAQRVSSSRSHIASVGA